MLQTVVCQTHSSCEVGAGQFSETQSNRKLHTFLMNKAHCSLETKTTGQVCAVVKALELKFSPACCAVISMLGQQTA